MSNDNITLLLDAMELNFREICMGNIAPKTLFRSSHAIRKEEGQEKAFALLAENTRIASVINLHDANSKLPSRLLSIPWYKKLIDKKRVIATPVLTRPVLMEIIRGKRLRKKVENGRIV